jgi:hypothetical protein
MKKSMESDLLDVVHGGDSGLGIRVTAIADEAESTAATSVTVLDDDLCELRQFNLSR